MVYSIESKLIKEQEKLAKNLILEDTLPEKLKTIGGTDVAYKAEKAFAAVSLLDFETLELIEIKASIQKVNFPYKAGLLAYREAKPILSTFAKLKTKPQVLLVDAHGIAHPRGFGLASYIGLKLDAPTIGVAKTLLCGKIEEGKIIFNNEIRGFEIRLKSGKPLYISPGHKISIKRALEITLKILTTSNSSTKLLKPIQLAHEKANELANSV